MKRIKETVNNQVEFLLAPRSYEQIYSSIKLLLQSDIPLLQCFSRPYPTGSHISWHLHESLQEAEIRPWTELTEEERQEGERLWEQLKGTVIQRLQEHQERVPPLQQKEFQAIQEHLFTTPDGREDLFLVSTGAGQQQLVIAQWGLCWSVRESDNNRVILDSRPALGAPLEVVLCFYDQKEQVLPNRNFQMTYRPEGGKPPITKGWCSDENGTYRLGSFPEGAEIEIYDLVNGEKKEKHRFTVDKGAQYKIVFPVYARLEMLVVDQFEQLLSGHQCRITLPSEAQDHISDHQGKIEVEQLLSGLDLEIESIPHPEVRQSVNLVDGVNRVTLTVRIAVYVPVSVEVQDQDGNSVPGFGLTLSYEQSSGQSQGSHVTTDGLGQVTLTDVLCETQLRVSETDHPEHKATYQVVEKTPNHFVFRVEIRKFTFRIDGYPNSEVQVIYDGQTYDFRTDAHGNVIGLEGLNIKTGDELEFLVKVEKGSGYRKLKLVK